MARTRATKPAAGDSAAVAADTKPKYSLPAQSTDPPMLFVLPRAATPKAKIVTLPNPRYSKPARYLVCPETGVYEFTKVSAPKSSPRSWLIETSSPQNGDPTSEKPQTKAQISKGGDMYMATPIDPLFLALPALVGRSTVGDTERLFITSECHLDNLPEEASHLQEILRTDATRVLFEKRIEDVCDHVRVGEEKMYRLNEEKLVQEVLTKAKRLAESALPPSMEEKFVKKALEAPILVQKRDPLIAADSNTTTSEASTPQTESAESQTSIATAESAASSFTSQVSTAATSVADDATTGDGIVRAAEASEKVISLQRLRIAFNFICSSYIAPNIAEWLQNKFLDKEMSPIDFQPLDEYLSQLTKLRAEAMVARSMGFSRKHDRDEEQDVARAEKKRKMEEEKKKKSLESRGIRDLKKVNTSGMKKLSEFFKKK